MAKVRLWVCVAVLLCAGTFLRAQEVRSFQHTYQNQPLTEVFSALKRSYGIIFAYDPAALKDIRVSGSFESKSLTQALRVLLAGTDLDFQIVKNDQVVIKPKSQIGIDFRGIIRDKETGEPLPYASILIPNTKFGTTADENGRFFLKGIPKTIRILQVQYVGYQPIEYQISNSMSRQRMVLELVPMERRLDEIVIVQGTDQSMKVVDGASQILINPKKISALSGLGEEDIFRSMKLLPGISGSNAGSSGLYVRGGTPDQNLVLFDGITAYRVDHFFGLFSAFNAEAIQHLDVFRGGFGAKYGGRVSSVVDITGRNGSLERPTAGAGANFLNAHAVVETPLFKKKGSFLLAARRSYGDALESPFFKSLFHNIVAQGEEEKLDLDPEVLRYASASSHQFYETNQKFVYTPAEADFAGGATTEASYYDLNDNLTFLDRNRDFLKEASEPGFHYYDINAKLTYQPSKKDVVSVSVYSGNDILNYEYNSEPLLGIQVNSSDRLKLSNFGTSLNWSRQWNSKIYSKTNISHSRYGSIYQYEFTGRDDRDEFSTYLDQRNSIYDLTLRSDTEWNIDDKNNLGFGAQLTQQNIDFSLVSDTFHIQNRNEGATAAAYVQHRFHPNDQVDLTVGLRGTYFDLTKKLYVEPRLALKLKIDDHFRIKGAWGIYNQFINRVQVSNGLELGEDFWALANGEEIPITRAQHFIIGAAYETPQFLVDVEAYRKTTLGLLTYSLGPAPLEIQNEADGNGSLLSNGTSQVNGVDFLVQKKVGLYTGWVSYSLSRVTQRFPEIDRGRSFPAIHDQQHEIKTAHMVSWRDWDLASTFIFASGKPYTSVAATTLYTLATDPDEEFSTLQPSKINAQRLPSYHRLDLSLTYNLTFKWAKAKVGVSVYNLYNKENIRSRRFFLENPNEKDEDPIVKAIDIHDLGLTPNIYFHVRF